MYATHRYSWCVPHLMYMYVLVSKIHLHCSYVLNPCVPLYVMCLSVRAGEPCHVNGATHKDGDTFQPNCKQTCTCQNGVHACVSNCPQVSKTLRH